MVWFYGFMLLRLYGVLALRLYSFMVVWCYGFPVLWLYGVLVSKNIKFPFTFLIDIDPMSKFFKNSSGGYSGFTGPRLFQHSQKHDFRNLGFSEIIFSKMLGVFS